MIITKKEAKFCRTHISFVDFFQQSKKKKASKKHVDNSSHLMPLVAAAVFCGASWYFLKSRGEHKPNFLRGSENHFVLVFLFTIFVGCRLTKYLYLLNSKSTK